MTDVLLIAILIALLLNGDWLSKMRAFFVKRWGRRIENIKRRIKNYRARKRAR